MKRLFFFIAIAGLLSACNPTGTATDPTTGDSTASDSTPVDTAIVQPVDSGITQDTTHQDSTGQL